MEKRIIILGGGPAGLAAGYYLTLAEVPSTIYESEQSPGGMCRTFDWGDIRFDLGAHRLHNIHPKITDMLKGILKDDLRAVNVPSRVFHSGRWAKFPLTPMGLVKTLGVCSTVKSVISVLSRRGARADNFRDDAILKYSKTVAESFLINYSEKLWGLQAEMLSPSISGKRLDGLTIGSLMKDLLFRKHTEHLDGAFFYPRLGFGQITDALAFAADIRLCKQATKVIHANGRISAVVFQDGEEVRGDRFVSAIPLITLIEALDPAPPKEILDSAASLRFRHLRLAVLLVDRPFVVRSASLYFPDKNTRFTRIYEPKNRSRDMAPPLKTCLVVEYPYFDGDDVDAMSDNELLQRTKDEIVRLKLVDNRNWSYGTSMKIRFAYPVLTTDAASKAQRIRTYLDGLTNLHVIGRAAEFEYTHFHDLMLKGKQLAEKIARDRGCQTIGGHRLNRDIRL